MSIHGLKQNQVIIINNWKIKINNYNIFHIKVS